MMDSNAACRCYVGNLPPDVREKEVEDLFWKYGKIKYVNLKNQRVPPYAFVEFEDARDAEDAVRGRNGYNFDGYKLRVEHPRGRGAGGFERQGYGSSRGRPYFRGRGGPPSRRTNYRVLVTGLPSSGSWQDLKDHMREAGDVCYSDVYKDGSGTVEFVNKDDMQFAVKHLDDTKFKSHEGDTAYIRVKVDGDSPSRRRSRSRSPRRSPSYSPRRRSKSYSPQRRSKSSSPQRRSKSPDDSPERGDN